MLTPEQIAVLKIGDTFRVNYTKPVVGVFAKRDAYRPNLIGLKDAPDSHVTLWVDLRDPRLELVEAVWP